MNSGIVPDGRMIPREFDGGKKTLRNRANIFVDLPDAAYYCRNAVCECEAIAGERYG